MSRQSSLNSKAQRVNDPPLSVQSYKPGDVQKTARNEPCPCGSGRKYKKCCLSKDRKVRAAAREVAERAITLSRSRALAFTRSTSVEDIWAIRREVRTSE